MAKKRKISTSKSIIFRLALLAFCVYTIYSMISLQSELVKNKRLLAEKKDQITRRQLSNKELEYLLTSGSQQDLIERAARDKLDYVYANEEVYEDISGK